MSYRRDHAKWRLIGSGGTVLLAVLLTACGGNDAGSQASTTSADSADCASGAAVTSNLQPAIRQLTDSLNAVGPASERNDREAVLAQIDGARRSADQISAGLGAAAGAMTATSLIRTEFQNASASGAGLRDSLDQLRAVVVGGPAQGDPSAQLQNSVASFNASVERLSLACSANFSGSTVEPTTTVAPTRTTR
ncbi:hypothetical protein ACIP5Y_23330 [Nocardia sp. NPDC088792]|uniref:hypothetical protein n=1 Tax=Nocardia sp. NPDC088792 TaxID=3364332 RepID=UPI0037F2747E